jgi:hypothetical protein
LLYAFIAVNNSLSQLLLGRKRQPIDENTKETTPQKYHAEDYND